MPLAKPHKGQNKKAFIAECAGDTNTRKEFPDQKQRLAYCYSAWERKKETAAYIISTASDEFIYGAEATDKDSRKLNKPFRLPSGSTKKFGVVVVNKKGNRVLVKFGDPNMEIKRDDPEARKNFRARHGCDNATDKTTPRYWACKTWTSKPVSEVVGNEDIDWSNLPAQKEMWDDGEISGMETAEDNT